MGLCTPNKSVCVRWKDTEPGPDRCTSPSLSYVRCGDMKFGQDEGGINCGFVAAEVLPGSFSDSLPQKTINERKGEKQPGRQRQDRQKIRRKQTNERTWTHACCCTHGHIELVSYQSRREERFKKNVFAHRRSASHTPGTQTRNAQHRAAPPSTSTSLPSVCYMPVCLKPRLFAASYHRLGKKVLLNPWHAFTSSLENRKIPKAARRVHVPAFSPSEHLH